MTLLRLPIVLRELPAQIVLLAAREEILFRPSCPSAAPASASFHPQEVLVQDVAVRQDERYVACDELSSNVRPKRLRRIA